MWPASGFNFWPATFLFWPTDYLLDLPDPAAAATGIVPLTATRDFSLTFDWED